MSSPWWGVETPGEGVLEGRALRSHLAQGKLGKNLGVTLTADQRAKHRPPGLADDIGGYRGQLIRLTSSSFSTRCL